MGMVVKIVLGPLRFQIKKHINSDGSDIKYFVRFNYKEKLTKDLVKKKLIKKGVTC